MTPTIRIDDEVWQELQKRGRAFVDTPNDVLRRLLHLSEESSLRPASLRRGGDDITTEKDYQTPILEAIVAAGGRARAREVLDAVGQRMRNRLKPADFDELPSGEIRWRNAARWSRNTMARKTMPPLLNPSSPNGWWEITEAGREYLRKEGLD